MGKVLDATEKLKNKKLVDYLRNGGKLTMTIKDEDGNLKKVKMSLKKKEM